MVIAATCSPCDILTRVTRHCADPCALVCGTDCKGRDLDAALHVPRARSCSARRHVVRGRRVGGCTKLPPRRSAHRGRILLLCCFVLWSRVEMNELQKWIQRAMDRRRCCAVPPANSYPCVINQSCKGILGISHSAWRSCGARGLCRLRMSLPARRASLRRIGKKMVNEDGPESKN